MSNFEYPYRPYHFRNKKGNIVESLDDRFNNISNYINDVIVPFIDTINFSAVNGLLGEKDTVFSNINNDNTEFMFINDLHIDDNLLSYVKLEAQESGAIIGSDIDGYIIPISPTANDELLFLDQYVGLNFRKINTKDISEDSITGEKIDILNYNNFEIGTFVDIIPDMSITNIKNVTNDKIALDSIDFLRFGIFESLPADKLEDLSKQLTLEDFDYHSINVDKIHDNSISWNHFIDLKPIKPNHLKPSHINDNHLLPYVANTAVPALQTIDGFKASNFSAIINFPTVPVAQPNIITDDIIADGSISAIHFNQEIQTAIQKCRDIKNKALQPPVQISEGQRQYGHVLDYYINLNLYFFTSNNPNGFMKKGITTNTSETFITVFGDIGVQKEYLSYISSTPSLNKFSHKIRYQDTFATPTLKILDNSIEWMIHIYKISKEPYFVLFHKTYSKQYKQYIQSFNWQGSPVLTQTQLDSL